MVNQAAQVKMCMNQDSSPHKCGSIPRPTTHEERVNLLNFLDNAHYWLLCQVMFTGVEFTPRTQTTTSTNNFPINTLHN